jgi:hypothetical protein
MKMLWWEGKNNENVMVGGEKQSKCYGGRGRTMKMLW